ncbi:hypothetical protein FHG87_022212 [Trinorchestia longiramus]|nr:hypothetical protein FHG87_022212 [Trinorchestia longiramus]
MADIFNNMFFCNQLEIESPQSSSSAPPPRKSMGGQDLSDYLKAYRNKDTVDEEWKKVHEKGRGKKRFKKLVNKQIMISKLQNVSIQKRRESLAGPTGFQSQRFKPRGSIHESFLFTDQEQQRLAEIARENEEKRLKREEYLRQNKPRNDDRESLSSGHSRRRKKWNSKKGKLRFNDNVSLDSFSSDLNASVRSLEHAFKINSKIDEMNEESENDDMRSHKTFEEENKDDQDVEKNDEKRIENSPTLEDERTTSIENLTLDDEEEKNEHSDERDEGKDEHGGEEEEEEKDEKEEEADQGEENEEEASSPIEVGPPNRGINHQLIPPSDNLPVPADNRNGSNRINISKFPHRSPRSTRKVAPELTITPLRVRSVSRERSRSVAKSTLLSPRPSARNFPAATNKTSKKTIKKDPTTIPKKSLTKPKELLKPRNVRKAARAEQVKANPQVNSVKRTGAAAQSKSVARSPSRSRLAVQKNPDNSQKTPAKRISQKPSVKKREGNKDKKEEGVPMQNYGTVKF